MTLLAAVDPMLLADTAAYRDHYGHAVVSVSDPLYVEPTLTYTVGFHVKTRSGGYELAIVGTHPDAAARLLNDVAGRFWSTPRACLAPGMLLHCVDGYTTVKLRAVDEPSVMEVVHALYERPAPALQVMLPGPRDAFPDEPAYVRGLDGQRLL
ncbi:DUF4262 domain-containing protein [Streptomyces sp. BV286]|uniref:DUF4262 domain-containing protein n=1 Tax=Streptomyces sp. BV286 TaxID=2849672 RepID=UPI001C2E3F05|nr:DUF4262 domain-containing protein [Streptomyces sp. BV286]MBV1940826.1 DUF4262 domain-containing protein [Streptomyces sp. BV286]